MIASRPYVLAVVFLTLTSRGMGADKPPVTKPPVKTDAKPAAKVDGKPLLQKMQLAVKALKSVSYQVLLELEDQQAVVAGKVLMTTEFRGKRKVGGRYSVNGSITSGKSKPVVVQAAFDGETLRSLNSQRKRVDVLAVTQDEYAFADQGVMLLSEIFWGKFIQEGFKGTSASVVGQMKYDDVPCQVLELVQVATNEEGEETKIILKIGIGSEDFLPRHVDAYSQEEGDKEPILQAQMTFTNVKSNVAVRNSDFQLAAPEGYVQHARRMTTIEAGEPAADFTLVDAAGQTHSLKDYRGKVVLLDFWATYCGPCIAAMPRMNALHAKYKDRGLVVLGISLDGRDKNPAKIFKDKKLTYPCLLNGQDAAQDFVVTGIPQLFLIDAQGQVLFAQAGISDEVEAQLEALIAKNLPRGKPAPRLTDRPAATQKK